MIQIHFESLFIITSLINLRHIEITFMAVVTIRKCDNILTHLISFNSNCEGRPKYLKCVVFSIVYFTLDNICKRTQAFIVSHNLQG